MRDHKYKAWHKEMKLLYAIELIDFANSFVVPWNTEDEWDFKDIELIEYTGLKDKNGVEIYEGNIVKCLMIFEGGSLPHMGEIVYMEEFGAFATKNLSGETLLHNHLLNTFEVIGNIYENPELLKEFK